MVIVATDVEGIFRLSGSEKRIKELRTAFNTPERYGKGLDWTGYTVHDAANILRRYFNQLPEPIIPLEFYERFREPLRNHQSQAVGPMDNQSPIVGDFDANKAIRTYQKLITELPALNRQLLLYILDLLAVFASKSDLNKMTTSNLSAIFQPGILSHPSHAMSPNEYRLSQDVLIFLIDKQDHFLIGMQGTAADAQTVKDVESGPPTPVHGRTSSGKVKTLGRSGSAASKLSGVRRSVSVSSRQSRGSAAASPLSPSMPSPLTMTPGVGISRSNTVPSKRGSAAVGSRRMQPSEPSTPELTTPSPEPTPYQEEELSTPKAIAPVGILPNMPIPAPPHVVSASSSETQTPLASPSDLTRTSLANDSKTQLVADQSRTGPTEISAQPAGSRTSGFANFLNPSKERPTERSSTDKEQRKPNKLQKKRVPSPIPGGSSSARNSQISMEGAEDALRSQSRGRITPLPSPGIAAVNMSSILGSPSDRHETQQQAEGSVGAMSPALIGLNSIATPRSPSYTYSTTARAGPENPEMSPANSLRSHSTTTGDELDRGVIPMSLDAIVPSDRDLFETNPEKEKEKRRRWFSRGRTGSGSSTGAPAIAQQSLQPIGASDPARMSRSSFGSATGPITNMAPTSAPSQSGIGDTPMPEATLVTSNPMSDQTSSTRKSMALDRSGGTVSSNDEERDRQNQKNPIKWIQSKMAERAERKEEKEKLREMERAKSPGADSSRMIEAGSLSAQALVGKDGGAPADEKGGRGKSFDLIRGKDRGERMKSMDVPRRTSTAIKEKDAAQRLREDEERGRERSREAASGAKSAAAAAAAAAVAVPAGSANQAASTPMAVTDVGSGPGPGAPVGAALSAASVGQPIVPPVSTTAAKTAAERSTTAVVATITPGAIDPVRAAAIATSTPVGGVSPPTPTGKRPSMLDITAPYAGETPPLAASTPPTLSTSAYATPLERLEDSASKQLGVPEVSEPQPTGAVAARPEEMPGQAI